MSAEAEPPDSPTLWRQARDLFDRLAGRGEATRLRALEGVELAPELRRAVGTLLELDRSDEFLEIPWAPPEHDDQGAEESWIGSRLGPYRLVLKIGEGGSGLVFEAERDDAEFEHRVAVKILSRTPDEATHQRFRRERQILARLVHPHIARLIGGGTTPAGRPYFIMELVEGEPITTYCDRHRLPIEARLDLFRDVCHAVQHAHRNLIVHRDLKPSNILVSQTGEVKLLDFGIAKLLEPVAADGEGTEPTRWMTPSYASPEQISGRPITTSSDLYSLGVLLYELLCGRRPHQGTPGDLLGWSPESPRVPPSQAWDRPMADGDATDVEALGETAKSRGLSPTQLRRHLRGDLDHIVMRALRDEPEQRWPSADQLSADVRRHLAGQPIEARRGTLLYRAAKLVHRHRMAAILAAVLGSLVLGLSILSLWQADRRAEERDLAQREKIKAETVSQALIDLFRLLEPISGREYSEAGKLILDQGSQRIDGDFADQPEVQATLRNALGSIYYGLGFLPEAEGSFEAALYQRRQLYGSGHPEVTETLGRMANLRLAQGKLPEAEALVREALDSGRQEFEGDHVMTAAHLAILGKITGSQGDFAAAAKLLNDAVAMELRLGHHQSTVTASHLNSLGVVLRRQGRLAESEQTHRRALAIYQESHGEKSVNVGGVLNNLASLAFAQGDYEASIEGFREALEIWRPLRGSDHPEVQAIIANLAVVLHLSGDLPAAEALYRESLALRRERLGNRHPDVAMGSSNLGGLLREMGRFEEARVILEEALALRLDLLDDDHPGLVGTLQLLGLVEIERGDLQRARELLARGLTINSERLGAEHLQTGISHLCLAKLELAEGRAPDASDQLDRAGAIFLQALPADHWRHAEVQSLRGEALARLGRIEEARPLLARSLAKLREARGPDSLTTRKAADRLALLEGSHWKSQ